MYIFLLFYRCLVFVPSMLCLRVVGAGVAICLEQGADLHMAQLHAGCHSLSLGSVKNRAVKRVCVCVCVCVTIVGLSGRHVVQHYVLAIRLLKIIFTM